MSHWERGYLDPTGLDKVNGFGDVVLPQDYGVGRKPLVLALAGYAEQLLPAQVLEEGHVLEEFNGAVYLIEVQVLHQVWDGRFTWITFS